MRSRAADRGLAWQSRGRRSRAAGDRGVAAGGLPYQDRPRIRGAGVAGRGVVDVGTADTGGIQCVLILLPLSAFESTAPLTGRGIHSSERSRQSAARILALVDGASRSGSGSTDSDAAVHRGPAMLRCTGLGWGWPGGPALRPVGGLTRDLAPGSRLVIAGPSGSGKVDVADDPGGTAGAEVRFRSGRG